MLLFVILSSLPFISSTNILGMETFLDSFENSESYQFLNNNGLNAVFTKENSYIILQKTDHPKFCLKESDTVLYSSMDGQISCDKINNVHTIGAINKYEVNGNDIKEYSETVYPDQIIGKVVNIVDKNIWNKLSLEIWSITIENSNIYTFF